MAKRTARGQHRRQPCSAAPGRAAPAKRAAGSLPAGSYAGPSRLAPGKQRRARLLASPLLAAGPAARKELDVGVGTHIAHRLLRAGIAAGLACWPSPPARPAPALRALNPARAGLRLRTLRRLGSGSGPGSSTSLPAMGSERSPRCLIARHDPLTRAGGSPPLGRWPSAPAAPAPARRFARSRSRRALSPGPGNRSGPGAGLAPNTSLASA
jgi:hypothetical protein